MVKDEDLELAEFAAPDEAQGDYLVFRLGKYHGALAARWVRGICACPQLFSVINASEDLRGVLNFHGEVIPVFDWALRHGWPNVVYDRFSVTIVYGTDQRLTGVMAERVCELVVLAEARGREVTRDHPLAALSRCVVTTDEYESLYLLDEELLLLS